jgi:hypothetical protein
MSELITAAEAARLEQAEQVIAEGLQTFVEVGRALTAIRDERLYRAEHGTFEEYCSERWQMTDRRARQLMTAAEVIGTMVPVEGVPMPTSERQMRELAKVPEPERAEVWERVVVETEGKPTAKAIREAVAPTPRIDPFQPPTVEPPTPEEAERIEASKRALAEAEPDKDLARRQRVATDLLDRHVYNLSLICGSAEIVNYTARLSSTPITHKMLDQAEEAVRQIRKVLTEKGEL